MLIYGHEGRARMNQIVCRAIGLAAAADQHGKSPDTDRILLKALAGVEEEQDLLERLSQERDRIAPNCASCMSPCGNTADYKMSKFLAGPAWMQETKDQIVEELEALARRCMEKGDNLPDLAYTALAYLSYDMNEKTYERLKEELKAW